MTPAAADVARTSTAAHRAMAEAHENAAEVLRQRNPLAAERHEEQARTLRAIAGQEALAG